MNKSLEIFSDFTAEYLLNLTRCFDEEVVERIEILCHVLSDTWEKGKVVYLCGNGGSAANAIHLANDFIYGAGVCSEPKRAGLRVEALSANSGVVTCLANDTGYDNIYSYQLEVKAERGDVLIVLSGSGNSENVVRALEVGTTLGMETCAIVGYDGGRCRQLARNTIWFKVNDMQVAEDTQLIAGHLCMKWLSRVSNLERA